ncbi:hypothetical protein ASA1KI_02920 [Opitutales bacterium ASA1]|nr:hypothetical protein ASA1KI_02920 [Opitutales bacterium ASA1]
MQGEYFMNSSIHGTRFLRSCSAAALLLLPAALAAQIVPTPIHWNEGSTKESWVSFSAGYSGLSGNDGAFQRQRQIEDSGFVGLDSFRWRKSLENDRVLTVDGKALYGNNEYLLRLRLDFPSGSWFSAGYRESRVFYDGSGGFFPRNNQWFTLYDDELFTDRGEAWVEFGLVEDKWTFKARAAHQFRDGTKDSTLWGDTALTGGAGNRNIVPAFLTLDEARTILTVDFSIQAAEATKVGGGVRYEQIEVDDSRNVLRRPFEVANSPGNQERAITTWERSNTDLFAAHGFFETRKGEKLLFTGAASLTTIDTNISGSRIYGATYDAPYSFSFPRSANDHGYFGLTGGSSWDQTVLTGNMLYLPTKDLRIAGGLRYENQRQDTVADFIETGGGFEEEFEGDAARDFNEWLATVDATYNGVANWVFSANAEFATGDGDLIEEQIEHGTVVGIDRETDYERDYSKIGFAARWYPSTKANVAVGAYRKIRDNAYEATRDNTPPTGGNRFPAYITAQKLTTDDVYVRGTWRPIDGLSLVGRVDHQTTDIDSQEVGLNSVLSAELTSRIYSGTASWTPHQRVFVQAGLNWVDDELLTGTTTANALVAPSVGRFKSNYASVTALVLFMIDDRSDLQVDFAQVDADNLEPISAITQPYGLTSTDETFGATYTLRFSSDLAWSLRYAYGKYEDLTSGGRNDFESHIVYSRVQYRF